MEGRLRRWVGVLALLWCVGFGNRALASAGEHSFVTGLGYSRMTWRSGGACDGLGVLVGYRWGLADDWNLVGSAGYTGFLNPDRRFGLLSASALVAYLVDALTFVPEIRVGMGYVGPVTGDAVKHDVALIGGVGLEYRRVRPFGVGVVAEYRYLVRSRHEVGGLLSAMLYVAKYF